MKTIAVIDIGKTNAKLAIVDLDALDEIAVLTRPNQPIKTGPYSHFDTDALWDFIASGLASLARDHAIDGISITTHGASAALLGPDGHLAAPVLDYEEPDIETTRAGYDLIRPPFAETGSAPLSLGLNLGAQIHYQLSRDPGLIDRVAQIVTWPQYWAARLTGKTASDVCSLGCHTDLWNPYAGDWSSLPARLGIAGKMAPPVKPSKVLGPLLPDLQEKLGLGPVPVLAGIHDSNASLVPHLGAPAPFSVVSTGTWVIVMSIGATPVTLDPTRDMLINVNALGQPVPSARFMGGREYEMILKGAAPVASEDDAARVLERGLMLLPSVVAGCGPFPDKTARWTDNTRTPAETEVALGFYLALMTAECLANIGADGPTLVEGPFAANRWFRHMLEAATARPVQPSTARTGTALGAALLFKSSTKAPAAPVTAMMPGPVWVRYAQVWRELVTASHA